MKLSPNETRLFDLLPEDGTPLTTEELNTAFWRGKRKKPFNDRVVISNLTRALVKKTKSVRPRVRKSKQEGPRPMKVWLDLGDEA